MVIGLYEESGKTLGAFCETEGLEPKKLERWLAKRNRKSPKAVRLVEVEEKAAESKSGKAEGGGKYRLGFGNGIWLEIEGSFERESVRVLVGILREEAGC